jgi:hypothetical protein
MSTTPDLLPEPNKRFSPAKFLPLIVIGGLLVVIVIPMILFFFTLNSAASSSQNAMQESLSSHGVDVDSVTAERVRRACFQSGAVTTDVIAEFQGSKQVVTVQCGDGDTITDAVVRTLAPTVGK